MRVPTLPPAFRTRYATDDTRTCYACGFETTEPLKVCAACGYRLRTAGAVRRLGWVLVVMGGFLAAIGVALSLVVGRIIYQTGRPGATTTFTGGPEEVALIYGVFGFLVALGAAVVFGGAWQIRYGRPNRVVVAIAFAAVVALLVVGRAIRALD
jgi:hypothetical protein